MGTLQLSEIRTEIGLRLDNRTDNAMSSANVNRWINMAYYHMTHPSIHQFEELSVKIEITLVVNQREYDLHEDTLGHRMIAIRTVHYIHATSENLTSRRHRLKPRAIQQLDNRQPTSSEPRYYYMNESDNIIVDPYPNSGAADNKLIMRYWRQPTILSTDAQLSVMPDYYDELLVLGGLYRAEEVLNYRDRAEETKQNYVNLLNDASEKQDIEAYDWDHKSEVRQQIAMMTT